MECGCIKKRDFDLIFTDSGCEYLVIQDNSSWQDQKPEKFIITLKIASRNIEKDLEIYTDRANKFSSIDLLGASEVKCLPDEIYCITTESCGYSLSINRVYLCGLRQEVSQLLEEYSRTENTKLFQHYTRINSLIDSIEVNVSKGNLDTSKDLFKEVKDRLKNLNCDDCY